MASLKLDRIGKRFGTATVIHDVELDVADGEFVVFVGPSGCGKSTLLRMISGLEPVSDGDLFIDGKRVNDVPAAQRGLAMVFQSYALYPHMTVRQNLAFGLENLRTPADEIEKRVQAAAKLLRLDALLQRRPTQLSGGQRQRVAIGRAIVREPRIFLFDEPLSNLDAALRTEMRIELMRLHKDLGATMIYVTHDQVEAMTMADKIVVLNAGRVEQVGTPLDLYNHPRNRFVAGFIGNPKMNFIEGTVTAADGTGVTVDLGPLGTVKVPRPAGGGLAGKTVAVGIRPEHVALGGTGFRIRLAPSIIERLGIHTIAYSPLANGTGQFTALFEGEPAIAEGQPFEIGINPARMHLFDSTGQAIGEMA